MYESKQVEFKETVTNTYLKTVSAFSNYSGGKIYFGVKDDGEKIGLQNLDQTCLDIENRINDSISPKPDYIFDIDRKNNIIILEVLPGKFKPYLYKSKAYKRNGTSTIEVDRIELTRLILEGQNMSYDELSSNEKSLTFNELENKLREVYKINSINDDILKILQLYDINQNYNNAAQLLADNNNYPGVDIVRFGESINIILDRVTIEKTSILHQYEKAIEIYRQYYQYEEISGIERKKIEVIPEEAFREAVANAIVHRAWDINAHIKISMYSDRIEINSPGGLVGGVSEDEYLSGRVSILRNPIIGDIFFRLHYIERFGTGIQRINETYENCLRKPQFHISENSICVILPIIIINNLTVEEETVLNMMKYGKYVTSKDVILELNCSKSKAMNILKKLKNEGYINIVGKGKSTKYIKK